mmetsp:Transcript_33752/g.60745  ORF Transcript_33752/g.60745 Transcript_33752/m.60745 type:complete len:228 (+) Transcript_33752:240-923(+)
MLLRINLPHILHQNLLRRLPLLLHYPIIIILRQFQHAIHNALVLLLVFLESIHGKTRCPIPLVQIHQHLFLQFVLAVVNHDGIVVSIEAVDECLDGGFVEMTNVRRSLSRFLPQHHELRVNKAKTVDDDLPLHGLNGIHNQRHRTRIQRLERTLRINIRGTQPTPKPRMGMIPPHHHLPPPRLLQHIQHLRLKHRIHRLHTHTGTTLRHGEHIDAVDGVVVDELAEH